MNSSIQATPPTNLMTTEAKIRQMEQRIIALEMRLDAKQNPRQPENKKKELRAYFKKRLTGK